MKEKRIQFIPRINTPESGITLIEMSIALVIIALVVGGVVAGKEIIVTARIKQQLSQIENIVTSVNTFKLKFNCIPGDCASATSLGLGSNASYHNGNNDGKIDRYCYDYQAWAGNNYTKDSNNFFMHLANAGLVDGSFEGYQGEASGTTASVASINARYLKSKYGGYIFPTIFTNVAGACSSGGDYTAYTREAGNSFSIADYQIGIPYFPRVIPTDDVRRMDEKIDDRLPLSGNVGTGSNSTPMINNLQLLGAAVACNQATYALTVGTCDKLKIVFANRF